MHEVRAGYPDVEYSDMLVDAAAMHLIRRPSDFDVVIASNLFGDILTDEASMLAGSLGMLPSASIGARAADGTGLGMYEPIHGSAPDIAGEGIANPLAMCLCVGMLLRHSLGLEREADAVDAAVAGALSSGKRTADLAAPGVDHRHDRAAAVSQRVGHKVEAADGDHRHPQGVCHRDRGGRAAVA